MSEELENEVMLPEDEAPPEIEQTAPVESRDKALAQLDAYKRCFVALQAELAEIEQQFGADPAPADDPLKELTGEVSGFKGELAELRKMLEDLRQPQQQYQAPQPQPYYVQQPQMVAPAPLPYLQTPNYTPIMPAMPNFNR